MREERSSALLKVTAHCIQLAHRGDSRIGTEGLAESRVAVVSADWLLTEGHCLTPRAAV